MSRHIYQGTWKDQAGNIIPGGLVTVYLAESGTLATIYSSSTTLTSETGSVITADSRAYFKFYVDTTDYSADQKFKITLSKPGYEEKDYDDIEIIPRGTITTGSFDNADLDGDFNYTYTHTLNRQNVALFLFDSTGKKVNFFYKGISTTQVKIYMGEAISETFTFLLL